MSDTTTKVIPEEEQSNSIAISIKIPGISNVTIQNDLSERDDDSDQYTQINEDTSSFNTQSSAPSSFFSRSSTLPFEFDGHMNWAISDGIGVQNLSIQEEQQGEIIFPRTNAIRTQNLSAFFENLDENDPAFYDNAFLQLRFLHSIQPIFELDEETEQIHQASQAMPISFHLRIDSLPDGQVGDPTQMPEKAEESIDRLSKTM